MATPAEPPAKKRRTSAETRKEVVAAGIKLLREHGPSAGLDRVSLADAIAQTDVARPSAYRAFGSDGGDPQTNFRNVILLELINQPYLGDPTELGMLIQAFADEAITEGATPDELALQLRELVRLLSEGSLTNLVDDTDAAFYFTACASTIAPQPTPGVVETLQAVEKEAARGFNEMYRIMASAFGLRPRAGWTLESAVTIAGNLIIGFVVGAKVIPHGPTRQLPTGPDGELQEWSTLAISTLGTIMMVFEPDPRVKNAARLARWLEDPPPPA